MSAACNFLMAWDEGLSFRNQYVTSLAAAACEFRAYVTCLTFGSAKILAFGPQLCEKMIATEPKKI